MRNVHTEVKGGKLIITVDLSAKIIKDSPPTASGKNKLIASSNGNAPVPVEGQDIKYGLNVYAKVS